MADHGQPKSSSRFAEELSRAIAARGLTLQRIQSHLRSRGHSVSVATLSYWSNGRSVPSRSSSRQVLGELEGVLGLEPGQLSQCLDAPPVVLLSPVEDRDSQLKAVLASEGLASAAGLSLLSTQLDAEMGPGRRQMSSTTTLVVRNPRARSLGMTVSLDLDSPADICAEPLLGLAKGRSVVVPGAGKLEELLFDPPMKRGDTRRVRYRMHVTPFPDQPLPPPPVDGQSGFALTMECSHVVLGVDFTDEVPRTIRYEHVPSGPDPQHQRHPLVPGRHVEHTVPNPGLGLHTMSWEW